MRSEIETAQDSQARNRNSRRANLWAAVLARDPQSDGAFVYAVDTTGVYCRPTCPSRRPSERNVAFYASWVEAEAAGFRACLRCRPKAGAPADRCAEMIADACRRLQSEEPPRLVELAAHAGLSPSHFHRTFKAALGVTPKVYADAQRAQRFRDALAGASGVTEAIYAAGYGSNSRFYEKADEILGMAPAKFRKGGEGAEIRFALGSCSLGSLLVAQSDKGVCAISLGDDAQDLARELQDRFPRARLISADSAFRELVAKIAAFVDAPAVGLDLPVDLRGTAFQIRVWRALSKIPPGETVTYAEIARRIGAPRATRAVAGACAANQVAVAIPCHRVIRADGSLSGYRWGVERKRELLKREGRD